MAIKRIIRDRYLTLEEAAAYRRIREEIEREKPQLSKRIREQMERIREQRRRGV